MIFTVLYFSSFPLILYDNFFSMRMPVEKSQIARRPIFFLIVRLITYGSIVGLWFKYGWKIGIASLLTSWLFNKFSFRYFFRQYVQKKAQEFIKSNWFEAGLTPEERTKKAFELAENMALENATGKRQRPQD